MAVSPPAPRRTWRLPRLRREYGLVLLLLLVLIDLSRSLPPGEFGPNLLRVLRDQAHLGVLATGMTLVILTGGIDLSVGSIVALSAVAMGLVWEGTHSPWLTLATPFVTAGACGAVNGVLVAAGRVPPLIVTLATLSVFRGLAFWLSFAVRGGDPVGQFPAAVLAWSRADMLGLPAPVWITALVMAAAAVYLTRTSGGRAILAAGANPSAARLAGVPVDALRFRLYLTSALLAGLAALFYAARNDSVRADIGAEYELLAITIVVLGGTSVSGGEGSMAGTALGYALLVFLRNDMDQRQFRDEYKGIAVAVLLIGALLLDAGVRRHLARQRPGEQSLEPAAGPG